METIIQKQIDKLEYFESNLIDNIGAGVLTFINNNYKNEGFDGKRWKEIKNYDHPIGRDTEKTYRSMRKRERGKNTVEVGTDVYYAKYFDQERTLVAETPTLDKLVKEEVDKIMKRIF